MNLRAHQDRPIYIRIPFRYRPTYRRNMIAFKCFGHVGGCGSDQEAGHQIWTAYECGGNPFCRHTIQCLANGVQVLPKWHSTGAVSWRSRGQTHPIHHSSTYKLDQTLVRLFSFLYDLFHSSATVCFFLTKALIVIDFVIFSVVISLLLWWLCLTGVTKRKLCGL